MVFAEDLDQGFEPLSEGVSLAEAASVTEAVLNDNSASSEDVVVVDEEGPMSDGEEDPVCDGEEDLVSVTARYTRSGRLSKKPNRLDL